LLGGFARKESKVRSINFEYQKVGHIIMLDEKDWNRIVKFLAKNEVAVQEKAVQHRQRTGSNVCPVKPETPVRLPTPLGVSLLNERSPHARKNTA
jgi:hypothetical protein